MAKAVKTNVMRQLDALGVSYQTFTYEVDEEHLDGMHVAEQAGLDPDTVYKTLVLDDGEHGHLVCVIPVNL